MVTEDSSSTGQAPVDTAIPLVVYTAIFGGFPDRLYTPGYLGDDVRYVAFVDNPGAGNLAGWELQPTFFLDQVSPQRRARKHKLLAHQVFPRAAYSLWIDGCLTPQGNPWDMVSRYLQDRDLTVFRHCERQCIYRELEACIRLQKDNPEIMRAQIARYKREGHPYNSGLGETTAVLRRHTQKIADFNAAWWQEVNAGSVRDQLSFNYVARKRGVFYATFQGTRTKSEHFHWRAHR